MISRAAAVRVLYNSDIDVTIPNEAAKDRAQVLPSIEGTQNLQEGLLSGGDRGTTQHIGRIREGRGQHAPRKGNLQCFEIDVPRATDHMDTMATQPNSTCASYSGHRRKVSEDVGIATSGLPNLGDAVTSNLQRTHHRHVAI